MSPVQVWLSRRLVGLRRTGDGLFAGAFALAWLIGLAVDAGRPGAGDRVRLAALVVLALALTVPFGWRRRHPVAVPLLVFSAGTVQAVLFRGPLPIGFVVVALVASYSVGAHAPWRLSPAVMAYGLASVEAGSFLTETEGVANTLLTAPIFVVLPWAVGRVVARLRSQRAALSGLNVRLEHDRDAAARTSVLEERSRIARELHDIVAHSISVMVVQAGAAEQVIESGGAGGAVLASLAAIRTTGQQALSEMRGLLGVLRSDVNDTSALAPQPGLANVDTLIEQSRRDGLTVRFTMQGDPVVLPPGLDSAAFRLVQEALSNVRKHAHATSVQVTLRYERDCLHVDVLDDGIGAQQAATSSPGHGLIGMRERVQLYGGTLRAGARDVRGWGVTAKLPLTG